jgi:hypothetical protein
MANIRCFDSFKPNLTASELSYEKRKQIVFNEIQQNVKNLNTGNPVKKNGKQYNRNTNVNSTCDASGGYIDYAESYAILEDVRQGSALCYPENINTPIDTVQSTLCENLCSNTFANGFQDTGQTGGGTEVSLGGVDITLNQLNVIDSGANAKLLRLDTNANKDASYTDIYLTSTPIAAGTVATTTSIAMGTGADRYRNVTFFGSCDTTTNANPSFVIQFSRLTGGPWFSDGIEPSFFKNATNDWQFCFQRSNVPTQFVRLLCVTATTFNSLQVVLTKN